LARWADRRDIKVAGLLGNDGVQVGAWMDKAGKTHYLPQGGIGLSYKGIWGYAPLIISLANTREVLYLVNRPGNAVGWLALSATCRLSTF